jgi:hypothetical protein
MRVSPVAGLRRPTLRRTRQPGLVRRGTTIGMERTPARSPDGRLGADHLPVRRGVSAADFTRARSTPTGSEAERVFRRLKTCGHFGKLLATSEHLRPLFHGALPDFPVVAAVYFEAEISTARHRGQRSASIDLPVSASVPP